MRLGAFAAKWFVVHDRESGVCHWVSAFHASETITVPLGVQRNDGLVGDGAAAPVAAGCELVSIAC